jgi:hypothetical protein
VLQTTAQGLPADVMEVGCFWADATSDAEDASILAGLLQRAVGSRGQQFRHVSPWCLLVYLLCPALSLTSAMQPAGCQRNNQSVKATQRPRQTILQLTARLRVSPRKRKKLCLWASPRAAAARVSAQPSWRSSEFHITSGESRKKCVIV